MSSSTTRISSGKRTGGGGGITMPQVNPHWVKLPLFNRKNWSRVRFGDVVENVNERVEPSTAAEAIYVGLDDLDSGSLHIRRWGKGSDVIGTKLGFRKGDVIFGRRRAYQRKLAVAEVDGICSAHAMVARAKPKVILPEFLPFLMMSRDKFMSRAVDISVGSLSPTINWTTLKLEEFDLPPIDQQRRIAEILWALDETLNRSDALRNDLENYKTQLIDKLVLQGEAEGVQIESPIGKIPTHWNVRRLAEMCERVSVGIASAATHAYVAEGVALIRNQNIKEGCFNLTDLLFVTPEVQRSICWKAVANW